MFYDDDTWVRCYKTFLGRNLRQYRRKLGPNRHNLRPKSFIRLDTSTTQISAERRSENDKLEVKGLSLITRPAAMLWAFYCRSLQSRQNVRVRIPQRKYDENRVLLYRPVVNLMLATEIVVDRQRERERAQTCIAGELHTLDNLTWVEHQLKVF